MRVSNYHPINTSADIPGIFSSINAQFSACFPLTRNEHPNYVTPLPFSRAFRD